MAEFELPGIYDIRRYNVADGERLQWGQLDDGAIYSLWQRIERRPDIAAMDYVRVHKSGRRKLGRFGLNIMLLDDHNQPRKDESPSKGAMRDGIWTPTTQRDVLFCQIDSENLATYNGVFSPYSGDLSMEAFETELITAGLQSPRTIEVDLSSSRNISRIS